MCKSSPQNSLMVDVVIVGGGPGGLAAALSILTACPDLRVAVFERAVDIKQPRGASVGLQPNGLRALQAIDPTLLEGARGLSAEHQVRRFCTREGQVVSLESEDDIKSFAKKYGEGVHCAWHDLRLMLADSLPEGVLHTGMAFDHYEEHASGVRAYFTRLQPQQGEQSALVVSGKLLLGCDGNQSAVRQQLLADGPPSFMRTALWRAVVPVQQCPPFWAGVERGWHSWSGEGRSFNVFTLPGGRVSVLALAPWPQEQLEQLADASYIQDPQQRAERAQAAKARCAAALAGEWPPEVQQLLDSLDPACLTEHGQFYRDPSGCREWGRGRVALLGDAAHLGTPFLGQGTSQAFEDALQLGRAIHELGAEPEALRRYEAVRQPQASAVHECSVQLFKDVILGGGLGKKNGRQAEQQANVERGFVTRTFEPLPRKAQQVQQAQQAQQAQHAQAGALEE